MARWYMRPSRRTGGTCEHRVSLGLGILRGKLHMQGWLDTTRTNGGFYFDHSTRHCEAVMLPLATCSHTSCLSRQPSHAGLHFSVKAETPSHIHTGLPTTRLCWSFQLRAARLDTRQQPAPRCPRNAIYQSCGPGTDYHPLVEFSIEAKGEGDHARFRVHLSIG